jgi:arginine decarboxylase-like protein
MGDLHNLFGRVNEVHVFLDDTEPGGYYIEEVIKGNNISGVLSWIQYSATDLEKSVKQQIEAKVREGTVKPREGVELQNFYEGVLHGYTYVDYESRTPAQLAAGVSTPAGGTNGDTQAAAPLTGSNQPLMN